MIVSTIYFEFCAKKIVKSRFREVRLLPTSRYELMQGADMCSQRQAG